jgi:hypothetical protein
MTENVKVIGRLTKKDWEDFWHIESELHNNKRFILPPDVLENANISPLEGLRLSGIGVVYICCHLSCIGRVWTLTAPFIEESDRV